MALSLTPAPFSSARQAARANRSSATAAPAPARVEPLLCHLPPALLAHLAAMHGRLDGRGFIVEAEGAGLAHLGFTPEVLDQTRWSGVFPAARSAAQAALRGARESLIVTGSHPEFGEWHLDVWLSFDHERGEGAVFFLRDITSRKRLERSLLALTEAGQRRVGAEVHDDLGQRLVGLACLGQALAARLRTTDPAAAPDATLIAELANETHAHTRALAHGLDAVPLLRQDLREAFAHLLERARRIHRIDTELHMLGPKLICDKEQALHLYRIAQEALNNSIRHGHARTFTLTLDTRFPQRRLTLVDDGCGFDPAATPTAATDGRGLGRDLMSHRAAALGGQLSITSAPDAGTTVECVFSTLTRD